MSIKHIDNTQSIIEWLNVSSQTWHLYGLSPLWILLCTASTDDMANRLPQTLHSNSFPPVWTLMCLSTAEDWLNALWHTWHLYGLSPLWILLCTARCDDSVNRLPQRLHSNGFSPQWLCLCLIRALLLWKHFPHSVHWYLLLWTFLWELRDDWLWKRFSHWVHEYQLSSVCLLLWHIKLDTHVNCLSQTVHIYSLGLSWHSFSVMLLLLLASVFIWDELPVHTHDNKHIACE